MLAKNSILCWCVGGPIDVLPLGSEPSTKWDFTALGCWRYMHDGSLNKTGVLVRVLLEAVHCIVRDKVPSMDCHHALLKIDEYRDAMAEDMPLDTPGK